MRRWRRWRRRRRHARGRRVRRPGDARGRPADRSPLDDAYGSSDRLREAPAPSRRCRAGRLRERGDRVRKEAAHLQPPLWGPSACRAGLRRHDTAASFARLKQDRDRARITASSRLWTPSRPVIARIWLRTVSIEIPSLAAIASVEWPAARYRRTSSWRAVMRARPGPRPACPPVQESEDAHDRAILEQLRRADLDAQRRAVGSANGHRGVGRVLVPSSFAANSCRASAAYAGSTIWVIRFRADRRTARGGGVQPANSGVADRGCTRAPSASRSRERGQARSGGARRCLDRRRLRSGMRRS